MHRRTPSRGCPPRPRLAALTLLPAAMVAAILAGCGDSGIPTSGPAQTSPSGPSANTRDVCAAVDKAIADGASAFGNDLGSLVGSLAKNDASGAKQMRTDAVNQLKTMVTKVRAAAEPAIDPALVDAAKQVVQNISAMASDPKLLSGVRTGDDLGPIIEKLTRAADPLTGVCN